MNEYRKLVAMLSNQPYRVMKCFGLWKLSPNTSEYLKIIYKIYFCGFFIFGVLLFDCVMIIEIIINIKSVAKVINIIFMSATAIGVLGKLLTIKIKNQSYENHFKLMLNREYLPCNEEEKKLFLKSIKLNGKVRNFYATLSYVSCMIVITSHYSTANKSLPVEIYTFIGLDTNWKYNLVYVYEGLSVAILCLSSVAFDSLATAFFIHLKGQLDILGHRLENVGWNTNCSSQDFISTQLKAGVHYYNNILKLSHDIEYLVSIPISLQIGCSVFVLIANFYVISSLSGDVGKFIEVASYQACMLSQIFILCYFANEVSLKSSEISFNLYKSNWYNWNKINRKLVLLMMLRFKTPIRITSVNRCYSFNLAAFTSIVNSSYRYFALLKQTNR